MLYDDSGVARISQREVGLARIWGRSPQSPEARESAGWTPALGNF